MKFKEISNKTISNCVVAVIPPSIGLEGLDVVGLWINRGNKIGNLKEQDRMEEEGMRIEDCDDTSDYLSLYPRNTSVQKGVSVT